MRGADDLSLDGTAEPVVPPGVTARLAGAEISAGEGPGGKGFRLRVRVPLARLSVR